MVNPVSMNYKNRSFNEIFLDMMLDAFNSDILSDDSDFMDYINQNKKIENTTILDISIMAFQLSKLYENSLDTIYLSNDPNNAYEGDVEMLFKPFIGTRRPAGYAMTDVVFSVDTPATKNVTIPIWAVVGYNMDNGITFKTTQEVTLLQGQSNVTASVVCTTIGPAGNVPIHTITEIISSIPGIDHVDNPQPSSGGKNKEDVETYRKRGLNWPNTCAKGTKDAVIDAITGVATVLGYALDLYWDGYGSTRIVIDPPTASVLTDVQNAVNLVKAVDEPITVVGVEEVLINTTTAVNVSIDEAIPLSDSQKALIKSKVEQAIKTFIDGGKNLSDNTDRADLGIGTDFIPFQAARYVAEQIPEIKTMEVTFPPGPVTIKPNEKAVAGTITATVV